MTTVLAYTEQQTKLLTAEDLAQMPEDLTRHELVEGVLIETSRPKPRHGTVAFNLMAMVGNLIRAQHLGRGFTESGFILARNPDVVRGPDFAFISAARDVKDSDLDSYIEGAPDLAVEVVSPNDQADEVFELVQQYLSAGARLVWVIYSVFRSVMVYRADGTVVLLRATDELDGEDVLPGFRAPVSALFD